ncbi:MAG: nitroreductase family protein [Candidatus Bathyarchaeota archaeon]
MIYNKIIKRRTIRKYIQKDVPKDLLLRCVDAARLSPSGLNLQPLKYVIINDKDLLPRIFKTLRWAGYLPDYFPTVEEMPRAYIVILLDKNVRADPGHDAGIASMSISMVAFEEGLGSCILGAINRIELGKILVIPDNLEVLLVVALGYPAENPVIDDVKENNVKYWLDKDEVIHVPKRDMKDITHWNQYPSG